MEKESLEKLQIKKGEYIKSNQRNKKFLLFSIFLLLLLAVIIRLFYNKPLKVEVITVNDLYPYQNITILNASGYVVADRKSAVGAKITGRLIKVNVEEGMRVKKNDIVAELENEDLKASYQQLLANVMASKENINFAKAELEEAKKNFERVKILFERGFATQSELDIAESRYKKAIAMVNSSEANYIAAKAGVKSVEVQLEYTKLRAPFDGIILTKDADVGDIITPLGSAANAKAAVITMADLNSLYVEADVSEVYLDKIRKNQNCVITFDAIPNKVFEGYVHMILPTVDRTKSSVTVKIKFFEKSDQILPDMSAKISFLERPLKKDEKSRRLIINSSHTRIEGDKYIVFVLNKDRAEKRVLKIEKEEKGFLYVLDGIRAGEKIITHPLDKLQDKTKVRVEAK